MYIFMCLMFFKLGENKEFFEIYGVILNIVYRFILIMLVLILNIRIILIIWKICLSCKLMGILDVKVYFNE